MQDKRKYTRDKRLAWDKVPKPTCIICDEIDRLGDVMDAWELRDKHPQCKKCMIFMGGTHAGGTIKDSKQHSGRCSYCYQRSKPLSQ